MLQSSQRRLRHYHRRERRAQSGDAKLMEIGPGNAKGARKALARIEQIAHDRHAVATHMLEQLRRTMLAERQYRSDLETWIHGALHPMQLTAALERRQKGAHALIAHGGAIPIHAAPAH